MAEVTECDPSASGDRGQMILVMGVVLAVMFLALAVLVNAAIYTDNVATRGGDSAGEALEYRAGVVDAVGGLIDAENADGDDIETIEGNVSSGTALIDDGLATMHLRRGAVAEVNSSSVSTDTTRGLLIREFNTDQFEDWTVNATAVREFSIDLDPTRMSEGTDAVRIELNDTTLEIHRTGGEFVVEDDDGNVECSTDDDDPVRFDVTGERLDGEPCRFGWPAFDEDSEISLANGEYGGGSYELTVASDDDTAEVDDAITTEALYSVDELELRFDTPRLRYETTVRVAPGEPDV